MSNEPPFTVDHHLLGSYLRWPDGRDGFVGAISTSSAEGVIDPDLYPHPEQAEHAGRLAASMVLFRRPDRTAPNEDRWVLPRSWHVRDLDDLAGRILRPPRTKETRNETVA